MRAAPAAVDNAFEFIAARLAARLASGEPLCLLTVISNSGSVPQNAGACAVVGNDGLLWGTVGGGRLEGDAIRAAQVALQSGEPFSLEIDLADNYSREAGPICGGRMRLFGNPNVLASTVAIRQIAQEKSGAAEMTVSGPAIGSIQWLAESSSRQPQLEETTFTLPIIPRPKLVVVGAGHCGRAIAELGDWLGYDVCVIDERETLLDPDAFPPRAHLLRTPIAEFTKAISVDQNSFITLVSMGHRSDAEALEACIDSDAAYIGMVGSRRKVELLKRHFLTEGLASPEQWQKIATPIGLDIGAESIREIATSVLAQITQKRRAAR